MRLTIDKLDGKGESDYSAMLDAGAPPKIVRKLNVAPVLTAALTCRAALPIAAGNKVRLYQHSGALWFSGYLEAPPQMEMVGESMGRPLLRAVLVAKGELSALDRAVLSEHAAMGGYTSGEAVQALTTECAAGVDVSGVQDVAEAGNVLVETGERWSAAAGQIANCARAAMTMQNRALVLEAAGTTTRTLSETDAGFDGRALTLAAGAAAANDITVIGGTEPALYARDCMTANGTDKVFKLSNSAYKTKTAVLVEDDFHEMALDPTKWVNDVGTLNFTTGGVQVNGPVSLRYRDKVEIGGLLVLEQTGIAYTGGNALFGGLFADGQPIGPEYCIAGTMVSNGLVCPVIDGVQNTGTQMLTPGMLYEFRTYVFHPEPIRAGQSYASSVNNGANARTSQAWFGTSRIVLTMREIDPTNPSTLSSPQTTIYDGTDVNLGAYGSYCAMWSVGMNATLGHAQASNCGAAWVRSMAPGAAWRTRLIGDVAAGADCSISDKEVHFTGTTKPVVGEQLEVFYRVPGLACGRVTDAASVTALSNSEDAGTRASVLHVLAPAPRTSLDCEQAARALLDDLTQTAYSGEYQAWAGALPQGASDVQPGEQWNLSLPSRGVNCTAIVREVEVTFEALSDRQAFFKVSFANDAAKPIAIRCNVEKHNALMTVVASALTDNVSARPPGLPDACIVDCSASPLTLDMGTPPIQGGGFEVRAEGDWGWGMALNQNLVGRFTSQTFTLPDTGVTQTLYLRQYDGSTPAKYSPYSMVLNLEV